MQQAPLMSEAHVTLAFVAELYTSNLLRLRSLATAGMRSCAGLKCAQQDRRAQVPHMHTCRYLPRTWSACPAHASRCWLCGTFC